MARQGLQVGGKYKDAVDLCEEAGIQHPTIIVTGALENIWSASWVSESPYLKNERRLEVTAGWKGEKGQLAQILIEAEFMRRTDDGQIEIVNWEEHLPSWLKDNRRKREERERKRRQRKEKSEDESEHVRDTSGTVRDAVGNGGGSIPLHPITLHNTISPTHRDPNYDRREDAEPTSVADVLGGLGEFNSKGSEKPVEQLCAEIRGQVWLEWFSRCCEALRQRDGHCRDVHDAVKRIADSGDPTKDVGEFKDPGAWLVSQTTKILKGRGLSCPKFPEEKKQGAELCG